MESFWGMDSHYIFVQHWAHQASPWLKPCRCQCNISVTFFATLAGIWKLIYIWISALLILVPLTCLFFVAVIFSSNCDVPEIPWWWGGFQEFKNLVSIDAVRYEGLGITNISLKTWHTHFKSLFRACLSSVEQNSVHYPLTTKVSLALYLRGNGLVVKAEGGCQAPSPVLTLTYCEIWSHLVFHTWVYS